MHKVQVRSLQQGIMVICMQDGGRGNLQKTGEWADARRVMHRERVKPGSRPDCGIISKSIESKGSEIKERVCIESIRTRVRCAKRVCLCNVQDVCV